MNNDYIHIEGRNDEGAYHRALVVARELEKMGRWDGQSPIWIINPYHVHDRVMQWDGIGALTEGTHYRVERQQQQAAAPTICHRCGGELWPRGVELCDACNSEILGLHIQDGIDRLHSAQPGPRWISDEWVQHGQ